VKFRNYKELRKRFLRIVHQSATPRNRVGFSRNYLIELRLPDAALRDEYATDETILDCFFAAEPTNPEPAAAATE